jgi:peptidoglycan/xylan/chitin deacetylase (PgdA/CDA1 family)
MPEAQFAARMRWLAASHYPVLPLDEAVSRWQAGTLPACAVVITIDDGWISTATHMAPILHDLRLPATLYVSTWYVEHQEIVVNVAVNFVIERAAAGLLDLGDVVPGMPHPLVLGDNSARAQLARRINQAIDAVPDLAARVALAHRVAERAGIALAPFEQQFRFMTPAQLHGMHDLGIAIELHGHRHQSVDMPGADLARELADNRAAILRAGVTAPTRHFCYPKGDLLPGIDVQLARNGVHSATTTRRGFNPPGTPIHRLSRLLDGPRISQRSFEAWLAGLYQPFDRLRG